MLKDKDGRRNRYRIQSGRPLPEALLRQRTVGQLLDLPCPGGEAGSRDPCLRLPGRLEDCSADRQARRSAKPQPTHLSASTAHRADPRPRLARPSAGREAGCLRSHRTGLDPRQRWRLTGVGQIRQRRDRPARRMEAPITRRRSRATRPPPTRSAATTSISSQSSEQLVAPPYRHFGAGARVRRPKAQIVTWARAGLAPLPPARRRLIRPAAETRSRPATHHQHGCRARRPSRALSVDAIADQPTRSRRPPGRGAARVSRSHAAKEKPTSSCRCSFAEPRPDLARAPSKSCTPPKRFRRARETLTLHPPPDGR